MMEKKLPQTIQIHEHLCLERLNEQHAADLFQHIDQHRDYLSQFLHWPRFTQHIGDYEQYIQRTQQEYAQGISCTWAIISHQHAVGAMSFNAPIDWQNKRAMFGYWLSPVAQGQGMISQAVQALIQATQPDVQHFIIKCAVHNERSNAVALRLGFQWCECLLQAEKIGEQMYDVNVYELHTN
ncbi:MAG: GNAT family N-acetyltransferase [Acinetobacter sp.]|nr:GNAT family N-acetyltransferase [Acinetobacter sp.]